MWLTVGDDLLASRLFDKVGEMVESDNPFVERQRVIGQLSPCRFGEGTTAPRAVEIFKSRLEYRSARQTKAMPGGPMGHCRRRPVQFGEPAQ